MSKKSNTSKRYTAEFKRDAVALVHSSDKTVTEVAREIGVSPEGLRNWVNQDKTDRGQGPVGALTTAEREELARLRRKVREMVPRSVTTHCPRSGWNFSLAQEQMLDSRPVRGVRDELRPPLGARASIDQALRPPSSSDQSFERLVIAGPSVISGA
ncbi:transposase [Streptomyces sp. Mg1]|uniref:transposase n=3 Tax=unclassified Streptomyces TaxID=2593676 RepID=UPI00017E8392|nr:transposase [Streptomyces sp. Mg1]EDX25124.1 hypothetical protein SSAG_04991 [Streptomyces sp. Mg1]